MIMISPNASQKVGKPPPPVPPRPSKTVVAEALAKSRQHQKVIAIKEASKSPARQAPPPPIAKSNSSYTVNVPSKKPPVFERSISEETRKSTRPVVYQSSNVKCGINNNSVQITRKDSAVKIVNSNGGGLHQKREDDGGNRVQVSRKDSVKGDRLCGKGFPESAGNEGSNGKRSSE